MPGLQDQLNTFNQTTAPTVLKNAVSDIGQYASTYTNPAALNSGATQQIKNPNSSTNSGNALDDFFSWTGTVAKGAVGLGVDAVKDVVGGIVGGVKFLTLQDAAQGIADNNNIAATQRQTELLSSQMNGISASYRAGRINQQQYKDAINGLTKTSNENYQQATDMVAKAQQDTTSATTDAIDGASDVIAVLTAGASEGLTPLVAAASKDAVDGSVVPLINFFGQKEVSATVAGAASKIDDVVQSVANVANKVSTINGKFPKAVIASISKDTLESGAANLTAKDFAKNVAINVLIKAPLVYQTNLGLASDVYKDIMKGNLTGAALTTMLTASIALASGPIGFALDAAKKTATWLKAASFVDGSVADALKTENEANLKNGSAALVSKEMIAAQQGSTFSRQSFIDSLSTHIGTGDPSQIYRELTERLAKGDTASYQSLKVMEDVNMKMAGGNSLKAAQLIADHYNGLDGGKWLRSASAGNVIDDLQNWYRAREAVVADAIKGGMAESQASRIVLGRANQSDLSLISDLASTADKTLGNIDKGDISDLTQLINGRLAALQTAINRYGRTAAWANSDTFIMQVKHILQTVHDTDDMTKAIKSIKVGYLYKKVSEPIKQQLQKMGYMAIMPEVTHTPYVKFEDLANQSLKTSFATKGETNVFEKAVVPVPVLASVTSLLTRLGLSPEAAGDTVQKAFSDNFGQMVTDRLKSTGTADVTDEMTGDEILSKLYSFVRDRNAEHGIHAPVTDLRQLTKNEVKTALKVTDDKAKVVVRSLNNAMLSVDLATRGAGDKLLDLLNTATGGLSSKFARLQGAARFVWNPFFRWQQSYQTETLAQLEARGGKVLQLPGLNMVNKVLFSDRQKQIDATDSYLASRNVYGQGYSGQGSGDVQGMVGTRIIKSERTSLAGLVNLQAKRARYIDATGNIDATRYIDDHFESVIDTLRTITANGRTNNWLDSPLARTLNTAFFPMRYNLKIAGLMASYIGKMSPATQVAIIAGTLNAADWLNSDSGLAWQQQYADAIKLFNWLSPTYSLSYVIQLGRDVSGDPTNNPSVSDLGTLGGLPFGMISQFLESTGVINTSAPYINPTSGEVYPKYVPTSARADVNLAIQSFLGSVFTYPGSMIGLPSKTSILKDTTSWLIGGNDFKTENQSGQLTPFQQHEQSIIEATNGTSSSTQSSPTPSVSQPTINVSTNPSEPPVVQKATKKKESQYKPTQI